MRALIWLLVLLFPFSALGEISVEPSSPVVQVGEVVDFTVQAPKGETLQYTLALNNKTIVQSEPCAYAFVSYVPREAGHYELTVTQGNLEETAACAFTAVETLQCQLQAEATRVQAGEPIAFSVEFSGLQPSSFRYEVHMDNVLIHCQETSDPDFSYTPREAGAMTVRVIIKDAYGHQCESAAEVTVTQGSSIRLTGESIVFPQQGGIRSYTVDAPGMWYAVSESDFVTLSSDCGLPGDSIILEVEGGLSVSREGTIHLYSDGCETSIIVHQHPDDNLEEESFFAPIADSLKVNGSQHTTLMNPVGQRILRVDASGPWEAHCPQAFVSLAQSENALFLTMTPNETTSPRSALVTLACGDAAAYVHLFQTGSVQGSQVREIIGPQTAGTVFRDSAAVQVLTDSDTQLLTLYTPGLEPALTFSRDEARVTPQGLWFDLTIPLARVGLQPFCLMAEGENGSGTPKGGLLKPLSEAPAFAQSTAPMRVDDHQAVITVTTTASTEEIQILDAAGEVLETCFSSAVPINLCVAPDTPGRWMEWTLTLPGDTPAAALRIGEALCPLEITHVLPKPFTIYSQFDGRWKDAPYRKSNLEQSGCAIFALSHALERLGYKDTAILPQPLADKYYFALLEGGTMNSTLVGHAGDDLGFKTRYELYTRLGTIRDKLSQGALFSFAVVNGHIAMVADISEDGQKFLIVDSAPSATFERIKNASLYREENGQFLPISDLSQLPGIRYYFETNAFGGTEYWLDASYVAKRGVRLIQPR